MRTFLEDVVTEGYKNFSRTAYGVGVDLNIRYKNENDDYARLAIKCDIGEIADILSQKMGQILGRADDDLEFDQEMERMTTEIRAAIRDGDDFTENFEGCAISAVELDHPVLTVNLVREQAGMCMQTAAFQEHPENTNFVRMEFVAPDGKKERVACLPHETWAMVTFSGARFEKKTGLKVDTRAVENFFESAWNPKGEKDFAGFKVTLKNTTLKPRMKRDAELYAMLADLDDRATECSPESFDDEMIGMLKKTRSEKDIRDELEEDAPEEPYEPDGPKM